MADEEYVDFTLSSGFHAPGDDDMGRCQLIDLSDVTYGGLKGQPAAEAQLNAAIRNQWQDPEYVRRQKYMPELEASLREHREMAPWAEELLFLGNPEGLRKEREKWRAKGRRMVEQGITMQQNAGYSVTSVPRNVETQVNLFLIAIVGLAVVVFAFCLAIFFTVRGDFLLHLLGPRLGGG